MPTAKKTSGPPSAETHTGLNTEWPVRRFDGTRLSPAEVDLLAVEEPLELRAMWRGEERPLGVLMRTPNADRELLRGWLHAEGLWTAADAPDLRPHPENPNVWYLHTPFPEGYVAREVSGACGICGSGSVERLLMRTEPLGGVPSVDAAWLAGLPERLRQGQRGFGESGGLHGAALFALEAAKPLCLFEDIGRHNAADKVVGWLLGHKQGLEAQTLTLVLSSRLGFEIVQKAALASIGTVVGVGASTSLAAQAGELMGLTLCGFARGGRLTVYAGAERLTEPIET